MARLFDDGASDNLSDAALSWSYPISMGCWFRADVAPTNMIILSVGESEDTGYLSLRALGDPEKLAASAFDGAGSGSSIHATELAATTWYHGLAVFTSDSSRIVYLDGTASVAETTQAVVDPLDHTAIGISADSTPFGPFDGMIAEAGFWNAELTLAEAVALAKGYSPLFVRPQSLTAYWPLIRGLNSRTGTNPLTASGTTVVAHPRIIYPSSNLILPPSGVVSSSPSSSISASISSSPSSSISASPSASISSSLSRSASISASLSRSSSLSSSLSNTPSASISASPSRSASPSSSISASPSASVSASPSRSSSISASPSRSASPSSSISSSPSASISSSASVSPSASISASPSLGVETNSIHIFATTKTEPEHAADDSNNVLIAGDLEVQGNQYIGGAVNYLAVSATGDMTMYGSADTIDTIDKDFKIDCGTDKTLVLAETVWHELPPTPITAAKLGSTAPTLTTFVTDIEQYTFDAANDYVIGATEITHGWAEGTTIHPHIHWATNGLELAAKGVKWQLSWVIGDAAEAFSAQTVSVIDTEIPASTADRTHFLSNFIATISGTNIKIGAYICWRLERVATALPAVGAAEPAADPFGLAVGFHAQKDTMGSREIEAK